MQAVTEDLLHVAEKNNEPLLLRAEFYVVLYSSGMCLHQFLNSHLQLKRALTTLFYIQILFPPFWIFQLQLEAKFISTYLKLI